MNSAMRRRLSLPIAATEKLGKEYPKIGKEIIIEVLEKSERRFSTIPATITSSFHHRRKKCPILTKFEVINTPES